MQVEVEKPVTEHRPGRFGPDALPVRRAIAQQDVQLRVFVYRIDAGEAHDANRLRLVVAADSAPDVGAPTREVRLEPAFVHFDADMTVRRAEAGRQRAILSPPVDGGHVAALDLAQANHAATSSTASVTRAMSSGPYR
jgi:hypothetical protein